MVYIILVLLTVFLFFFCLFLCKKNQDLSNKIKKLKLKVELEEKENLAVKNINTNKIPIKEISEEIEQAIIDTEQKNIDIKEENTINNILNKSSDPFSHAYEKDLLSNKKTTLSSIEIFNDNNKEKESVVDMNEDNSRVNLNDFIRRGQRSEELLRQEKSKSDKISFLEQISKEIEKELGPQTIELTDYEKEQEESAIISYQELLKVKEELYEINAAKENDEFIQDLKAFRNGLS